MGIKIAPPTLGETRPGSELTERARRALLLRDSVEGLAFARDALEDVEGERLDISQCRFTRCSIAPGRIKWLSFTDCVFENCDFSGAFAQRQPVARRAARLHGGGRGFFGKLAAIRAVPGCHAALREFFPRQVPSRAV